MARKMVEGSAAEEATESPSFEKKEDKGKVQKSSSPKILDEGRGHMVGQQHAGTQKPLNTSGDPAGGRGNTGGGFGKGGPQTGAGHMVPQQHAGPQTAANNSGDPAGGRSNNSGGFGKGKGVAGGTTKMAGWSGAQPAKPA